MKKGSKNELAKEDNSLGTASVVLGIVSLLSYFSGLILGIISLIFAKKQEKIHANKWSKAGKILGIIGIIVGVITLILNILEMKNPGLLSRFVAGLNVKY